MPQEFRSRRQVLDAIKSVPSLADLLSVHEDHFKYELDLEVIVYGRNYSGKKVGPYVRLLEYQPGEIIVEQGEWGGNNFYVVINHHADVFVDASGQGPSKVTKIPAGMQFGEESVLAGVPRRITVKAPDDLPIQVLEIQRPALRLLRKLPEVNDIMDRTYRTQAKKVTIESLKGLIGLNDSLTKSLQSLSRFRVYTRNHVLFKDQTRVDKIYIVREGWLRRSQEYATLEDLPASGKCWKCGAARQKGVLYCTVCGSKLVQEDFLGKGYCFGLEGLKKIALWPYTLTMLGRNEILEIPINKVRKDEALKQVLINGLEPYEPPPVLAKYRNIDSVLRERKLAAQQILIDTGLVDAANLLVMDMDLCVRCGNCSLACHKVHGQSRLIRRGIHLNRPKASGNGNMQSVLSPQVCMHCKDPECMTGCPTGAIGRFEQGQIDIEPKTCIGCGDCATQCPYDAISMVPGVKPQSASDTTIKEKFLNILRIRLDPLPPAVEQTEDLLAVKCNLCENTPLNPKGTKTPAYSCEENCPTGALARINPHTYFTEIGEIKGFALLDKTHAIGRNIHRSDPTKSVIHLLGILLTIVITTATILGLFFFGLGEKLFWFLNMRWITGLSGLAAIAGTMLYPIRRQIYRRRAGPLRFWMSPHAYSGFIAAVLLFLHAGVESGGTLTTLLMISFDLVIFTGIFGILCYLIVPRILTKMEEEPLLIDDLSSRREELIDKLAELGNDASETVSRHVRIRVIPEYLSIGFLLRQYLKRDSLDDLIQSARTKFRVALSELSDVEGNKLDQALQAAVVLRRVDSLIYLHRLLKIWLVPHIVTTSFMLALMFVHIMQVIYYAWR